jgi:cytochrome c oxidase subunit 2
MFHAAKRAFATLVFWAFAPVLAFAGTLSEAELDALAREFASRQVVGVAEPWQVGFQPATSPVMEQLASFHNLLLWVIFAIALFVMVLMAYVCVRFRSKRNPIPSKTTHHVKLEILWTALPVLIIVLIAFQSMRTLYYLGTIKEADMTLKVTGSQWYWQYQYPDHPKIEFTSNMLSDEDVAAVREKMKSYARPGEHPEAYRLLEVNRPVVLPVDTNIRVQLTASDVIHAWALPAFGVKMDATPGRLNETWMRIKKEGYYFGQCSELCGRGHAFMPIAVKAVSKEEFKRWTEAQAGSAVPAAPAAGAGGAS